MGRSFQLQKPKTGWRYRSWRACKDLPDGVPRWFRCQRCNALVTRGLITGGGCGKCGTRRLMPAMVLSWGEILALKIGLYPLSMDERAAVCPLIFR